MTKVIWVIAIVLVILIIALVLTKLNEASAQAAIDAQAEADAQATDYQAQAQDIYSRFRETSCGDNLEQCVKNWFKGGIHISSSMFLGAFA